MEPNVASLSLGAGVCRTHPPRENGSPTWSKAIDYAAVMSIAAERYAGCGHMGAEGRKNVLQGGVKKLSTKFTKVRFI